MRFAFKNVVEAVWSRCYRFFVGRFFVERPVKHNGILKVYYRGTKTKVSEKVFGYRHVIQWWHAAKVLFIIKVPWVKTTRKVVL